MDILEKNKVKVETIINAPVSEVWNLWTDPRHIIRWNHASEDWVTSWADNDLRVGGKFIARMEARDNSTGFDFEGEYTKVEPLRTIAYRLGDNRNVEVHFLEDGNKTTVTEIFDAESTHSVDMQRSGWQSILNNFKDYVEKRGKNLMYFDIRIKSSLENVYRTLTDMEGYNAWTSVFNEASSYEGSWEKRSNILFIGTDSDGKQGGMVSRIRENIPNKFISIEHLGIYRDGREITTGPEVESWKGALENYRLTRQGVEVLVSVDMDVDPGYREYFLKTWPRALEKLKEICEGQK
jgi:uncharacterized protein YndB with AHSA1/START domain